MKPSSDQALHFALMMQSGMPPEEAIVYFQDEGEGPEHSALRLRTWLASKELQKAILHLQGSPWHDLTLEARIRFAIDKHYSEMAYFLYSRNYVGLTGAEKQKADTCRQALEAKLAGMAGKMDALSKFWDDIATGKIKLGGAQSAAPLPV